MVKLSNKLFKFGNNMLFYYCKACDLAHNADITKWTWNGDVYLPSFTPSFVHHLNNGLICHTVISNGKIHYANNCSHSLKDKTIDLPDFPDNFDFTKKSNPIYNRV